MTETKHQSPPVAAECYDANSAQLSVALPGRHVAPEVYAAAERFTRACAAVRKAQAEIDSAGRAVQETENRVMREAYRAVAEDAEIDEDAKLAQSEDWASAKAAEETARARYNGARNALGQFHRELVTAAASQEWGSYLAQERQALSARITEDLSRAVETLRELEEVEGLSALVAAGGVRRHRRGNAVAPVETEATQLIRETQGLLRRILAPEVKAVRKLSAQDEWVRSEASDKTFTPVAFEEQA
ncbi:hypothetical protein ABT214_05965 [Micromonospora purpureochromogenes]|uniref:hypothetical protein n=1 Tax=Micromonospora purpureochromogenes TaxID=47872 RepID=UPI003328A3D9